MTINVRLINDTQPLEIIDKGDWIDLRAAKHMNVRGPETSPFKLNEYKIPLGIAMELPDGYEAVVLPRSSTFKSYGLLLWNGMGVIDNSYCGTNDEWVFGGIATRDAVVQRGARICQFRIQLSQKATLWQRIKWLFSNGKIKFNYVDVLTNPNRKGFGEGTGKK